ncbi:MAG: hypothetical protein LOD88_04045, partial [Novibacillus thermophilus]
FTPGRICELYPDAVVAAARAGHEIADHMWEHRVPPQADIERAHLSRACAAIERLAGRRPQGSRSRHNHELLHELGCRIVAVSDSQGAVYDPDGLELEPLEQCKDSGTVRQYPAPYTIELEELLELDVDILIPAAMENSITSQNAPRVKATIVAEAANGPTTPEADRILSENDVLVIPDILANAGGVTVSYFEWVQNLMNYYWKEEEVNEKLRDMMVTAYRKVVKAAKEYDTDLRTGAFIVSLQHIIEAMIARGWVDETAVSTASKATSLMTP